MLTQHFIKLFLVLGLVDISTTKSKNSILHREEELNIVFISCCNLGGECMVDCICVREREREREREIREMVKCEEVEHHELYGSQFSHATCIATRRGSLSCTRGSFLQGNSGQSMKLATHLHFLSGLRKHRTTPPFPHVSS